jgi:hypothetical protein
MSIVEKETKMCRLVLLLALIALVACSPTSITISLGAPTATPTPTEMPLPTPTPTSIPTPNYTATAQVLATATTQALATATAQARATATTQALATATAQAGATAAAATTQANATATAHAGTAATKTALLAFIDALVAKAGRPNRIANGQLDSSNRTLNTEMSPKNFVADIEFTNPADAKVHPWDLTFLFRYSSVENRFTLVLDGAGTWSLNYPTQRLADRTIIESVASGTIPTMNLGASGANKVRFVVYEKAGFLLVNGDLVGMMDLSRNVSAGQLYIVTANMVGHNFPGLLLPYKNVVIADLQ